MDVFSSFLRHSLRHPNSTELAQDSFSAELEGLSDLSSFPERLRSPLRRLRSRPAIPFTLPRPFPKEDVSLSRRLKARSLLKELLQAYTNKLSPSSLDISTAIVNFHALTKDELLCLHVCLDIPAPVQGDGGDDRHRAYLATELTAYFDGLEPDDNELNRVDVRTLSPEELYCACVDRCIWPVETPSLQLYLQNKNAMRLPEKHTYEDLSKHLPGLIFPHFFL